MRIQISPQFYKSSSSSFASERCINMFMQKGSVGTKTEYMVNKIAGQELFLNMPVIPSVDNLYLKGTNIYVVGQNSFYQVKDKVQKYLGSLGDFTGRVQFAELNEFICVLTPNNELFVYSEDTGNFQQVTDVDFPVGSSICSLTQRIIVSNKDTQQFMWSELGDPTSWTALGFASKEGNPDNLTACAVNSGSLWLIGNRNIEIWNPSSDIDLPYIRIGSVALEQGCLSKDTIATIDNNIIWVGDSGSVYMAKSYQAIKISTDAIDNEIGGFDLSSAFAFTYEQYGHSFYVLTIPGETTFVYDIDTGFWHERKSKNKNDWRVANVVYLNDIAITGDRYLPNLYIQSKDIFTEHEDEILWVNTFPVVYDEDNRLIHDKLLIEIDTGLGLNDNTEPYLIMDYSAEGKLWSNKRQVSIGKVGEYSKRALFRKLGMARHRIYRIQGSSNTEINITGAILNGRIGK
jgi:hypothetical protein